MILYLVIYLSSNNLYFFNINTISCAWYSLNSQKKRKIVIEMDLIFVN
jgi:predicted permease